MTLRVRDVVGWLVLLGYVVATNIPAPVSARLRPNIVPAKTVIERLTDGSLRDRFLVTDVFVNSLAGAIIYLVAVSLLRYESRPKAFAVVGVTVLVAELTQWLLGWGRAADVNDLVLSLIGAAGVWMIETATQGPRIGQKGSK